MESNKKYRFLITGGGGYVGFHIALQLIKLKHQVSLLDLNRPHRKWVKHQLRKSSSNEYIQTSYGSMQFIEGNSHFVIPLEDI